ncbi:hyaluronidase-like [Chrysoperla carnea]|uniref:hyaluronidase-like n=1 Tax=Chrysoperla carnea TaxID=189513 RepID=UPI001D06854D|nr:hyaluronidase-like [Chrysoperla carnea]
MTHNSLPDDVDNTSFTCEENIKYEKNLNSELVLIKEGIFEENDSKEHEMIHIIEQTYANNFYSHILCIGKIVETKFYAYWNAPTMQCRSHKINFPLSENYKIIQNTNDNFRGDRISILYDPGFFPALLKNGSNKNFYYRNGGIPQNGNLSEHLSIFYDQLQELIPDEEYNGLAIIDFESWRPIYRQNFGTLQPYRDISFEAERRRHPFWANDSVLALAQFQFERSARAFMDSTINLAKKMRPKASWGYYAYPYCFNMNGKLEENCPNPVPKENDKTIWLFESSDTFYPSLYFNEKKLTPNGRQQLIRGRITEAQRIADNIATPKFIIPYFWYKYQDTGAFLTQEDIYLSLTQLKKSGVNGVIFWGSSNDVNTKAKCQELHDYVEQTLGPIINEIMDS